MRQLPNLVVTPLATADLKALLRPIQAEDPMTASKLNEGFQATFRRLCTTGGSLRLRREFGTDIRVALFKPWMIFFRASDDEIVVLRVLHGAMHPKRISAATRER